MFRKSLGVYFRAAFALALGVAFYCAAGIRGEPMPSIFAARVAQPPAIDGKLDDAAWQKAQGVVGDFRKFRSTERAEKQTDVFATFDDKALYIAFRCHEPHPEWLKAQERKRDGQVWEDDCVELFLVPDPTKLETVHLIVNSVSAQYDELLHQEKSTRLPSEWNAEWQAKAHVEKSFWAVELAIPFAAIGVTPPIRGEIWKVRFAREDYTGLHDETGMRFSNWPASPEGFQSPTGYAQLVFESRNFILNSSFEEPLSGRGLPPKWHYLPPNEFGDKVERNAGGAPDGEHYMTVTKKNRAQSSQPLLGQSIEQILPNRRYRLSGFAKTDGPGEVICKTLPSPKAEGKSPRWLAVPIESKEWKPFSLEFETLPWETQCQIQVRMAFREGAVGSVSVDNLMLEQVVLDVPPRFVAMRRAKPEHDLRELAMRFGQRPYDRLRRTDGSYPTERVVFRDTAFGSEVWRMTEVGGRHPYPLVSPWNMNGSRMYFIDWRPHSIEGKCMFWVMDAQGENIQLGAPPAHYTTAPYWCMKDPNTVYYLDSRGYGLWACDVRTRNTRLVHQFKKEEFPRFQGLSRDGERLFVGFGDVGHEKGWSQGWTMKLDGSDFRPYKFRVGEEYPGGYSPELIRAIQDEGYPFELISHGHSALSPSRRWVAMPVGGSWCRKEFGKKDLTVIAPMFGADHSSWRNSDEWFIASADYIHSSNQIAKVFADGSRVVHPLASPNTLVMFEYWNEAHPVTSPDGTKVAYASCMMGWQDTYVAVISRPMPPRNLRVEAEKGVRLYWEPPNLAKEIRGYYVYRAERSGGPYEQLNREPVVETQFMDKTPRDKAWAYVVTSVEHSGLESVPSNEALLGEWRGPVQIWLEAEFGAAQMPMHLGRDAWGASNWHHIFLCEEKGVGEVAFHDGVIPKAGEYFVWLRVRRDPRATEAQFHVTMCGEKIGDASTTAPDWEWRPVMKGGRPAAIRRPVGGFCLTIAASGEGNALDKILLTDDRELKPSGFGNLDAAPPTQVKGLRVIRAEPYEAQIEWQPNPEPDLNYYHVYRGQNPDFQIGQESRIRSTRETSFLDWGLRPGKTYYRVTAVDRMGNEGSPSEALVVDLGAISSHTLTLEAENAELRAPLELRKEKSASNGACVLAPPEGKPGGLLIAEFEAPAGTYLIWVRVAQVAIEGGRFQMNLDGTEARFSPLLLWRLHGGSDVRRHAYHFEWRCLSAGPQSQFQHFALKDGRHRLTISNVTPGTVIDQIYITSDRTLPPADITGQGWR